MNKRNQSGDAALVVADIAKVGKDELLKLLNLVLKHHQIGNGLIALIGIVDGLQANVFFVFKRSVELGMRLVEGQLGEQKVDVFANQRAVAADALAGHAAVEAINPAAVGHGLLKGTRMALLQHFVDGDEGLESLDLVGHDGLPGFSDVSDVTGQLGNITSNLLTPSCQTKRPARTGGPMYRQCMLGHACAWGRFRRCWLPF